jgi:hypothetical protein
MAKKWYYNSRSGIIDDYEEITMWPSLHAGTGWHGPYATKEAALKYYNDNKAKNPGWKAPTESLSEGAGNLAETGVEAVASGIGLSDEELRSWLVRIGEILLGIVLVGVGVAKLTGSLNPVASLVKAKL